MTTNGPIKLDPPALMLATRAHLAQLQKAQLGKERLEQLGYAIYFERDFSKLADITMGSEAADAAMTREIQAALTIAMREGIRAYLAAVEQGKELDAQEAATADNADAKAAEDKQIEELKGDKPAEQGGEA